MEVKGWGSPNSYNLAYHMTCVANLSMKEYAIKHSKLLLISIYLKLCCLDLVFSNAIIAT